MNTGLNLSRASQKQKLVAILRRISWKNEILILKLDISWLKSFIYFSLQMSILFSKHIKQWFPGQYDKYAQYLQGEYRAGQFWETLLPAYDRTLKKWKIDIQLIFYYFMKCINFMLFDLWLRFFSFEIYLLHLVSIIIGIGIMKGSVSQKCRRERLESLRTYSLGQQDSKCVKKEEEN